MNKTKIFYLGVILSIISGCSSEPKLSSLIKEGDTQKSLAYINAGDGIDEEDQFGRTALHVAAQNGDFKVVKALLERGADVDAKAKLLTTTPIEFAAENKDAKVVNLLIENGATIDYVDNHGWTALKIASFKGNMEVIKALLKAGAKINKLQNLSSTALIAAVNGNQLETVKFLIRSGANIEGADENGNTPLLVATFKQHVNIVEYLLEKDVNIAAKNKEEQTAIIIASFLGNKAIVKSLLTKNANIHKLSEYGRSPLHLAAVGEYTDLVNMLFAKGAKPTVVSISEDDLFGTAISHGMYGEWVINNNLGIDSKPYFIEAVRHFKKAETEYTSIQDNLSWKITKNNLKSIFSVMFAAYAATTQAKINAKASGTGTGIGIGQYRIYGNKTLAEISYIFSEKITRSAALKSKYEQILKCMASAQRSGYKGCVSSNKGVNL